MQHVNAPIRVVMIGTSPSNRGGISSVVQTYRAAGLFDRWHVRYLATHTDGPKLIKALYLLRAALVFMSVLLRPPTFVHVHLASGASFWRKLFFVGLARARGIPVVLHVHGGGFESFYGRSRRWQRRVIQWMLECAEVVIALTATWGAAFRAMAPQATVVVIPNPVDVPVSAAKLSVEGGQVVFLGRLTFDKGLDVLLEAFARVASRYPQATLLLGGLGDHVAVETDLQRLGIGSRVRMLGWVDGDAKTALLQGADIYALPSRIEGLPVGMLEAMAHGVPVVVSRVGGVADALTDGVEGLIVPAGDVRALSQALCALLDDPQSRRRMGAKARARALAEFDVATVIAKVEQVYACVSANGTFESNLTV